MSINQALTDAKPADSQINDADARAQLSAALLECANRLEMAASDSKGRGNWDDGAGYQRIADRARAAVHKARTSQPLPNLGASTLPSRLRAIEGQDWEHTLTYNGVRLEAAETIEAYETALRSIAANTCCGTCQEAALVATRALG